MTARNVHLAKLKNAGVSAQKPGYRPRGFSWIGDENNNCRGQVTRHMFKLCVEASPEHVGSGRPGSDRKPDDTPPCDEPHRDVRNFHPAIIHAVAVEG